MTSGEPQAPHGQMLSRRLSHKKARDAESTAPERVVVLFTKPTVAGRVKTRMTPTYSPEQACGLHCALLQDVVAQVLPALPPPYQLEVAWAVSTGANCPRLEEEIPLSRGLAERLAVARRSGALIESCQQGGDLGERLYFSLSQARVRGARRVAAIGSDHPELSRGKLCRAFDRLADFDCVLSPTADGGYSSFALRAEHLEQRLFSDIDWSTSRVCRQTLERAAELGLRVQLTATTHDIDEPADLEWLRSRRRREGDAGGLARATLAWYEEHRMHPGRVHEVKP